MKELKRFPTTNYTKIPSKYYFLSVAKNIIKIADLEHTEKTILDFGCGHKIFSKLLKNQKIINYDSKPEFTECESYENLHFDIVIFNHVLMYMKNKEIVSTFENIKKINKNCEFIIGIGKGGLLNKFAAPDKLFTSKSL